MSASLLSNNPSIFTGTSIASQEMLQSNLSHFSKDQEREADMIAFKILEEANLWINANHKVALATVIKTWGSSPRQVGSKMIVNEKGEFSGSISGGLSLIHI